MITTCIPRTNITCSRFIFGTASLFNVGTVGKRRYLLDAAVASGFSHFDTAPYYGFGMAESDLSSVLRKNPNVTLTTKVGIYSPGGEGQIYPIIFARKVAGKLCSALSRPIVDFTLCRAKRSLDDSLRRIGRSEIDIYTLHEPEHELLASDEWVRWLEECVTSGKIRQFGIAISSDRLSGFLSKKTELSKFIQVSDSIYGEEKSILDSYGIPMQITYGYVSDSRKKGSVEPASEILKKALKRNKNGAIIVSTTKADRLPQYTKIIEDAL
ncbi:aldo/keto reductase [Pseudomonas helleri]|uniref:aldo/keto reductase n=1 Tax=Pseudomonas helleri TaxID=1608996 RepID=UPI003FD546EC